MLFCLTGSVCHAQKRRHAVPEKAAEVRTTIVSNVCYDLTFYVPSTSTEKMTGMAVVSFFAPVKADVTLDFQGRLTGTFLVNDKKRKILQRNGRITIPMKYIKPGPNRLAISFESKDDALTRGGEYLYTRFTQGKASSCFPCFDQPGINATFITHLNLPTGWAAMTNQSSNPISTDLYSFIAGKFEEQRLQRQGHTMRALYRRQDIADESQLPAILEEAAHAVKWMEDYTGMPYPFDDCGILILPPSLSSTIRYASAISLNGHDIFTSARSTQEEKLRRRELISHEIAHLWFGNMVAPCNSSETWYKEVLTNFLTAKMTQKLHSKSNYEMEFLTTCQARAMAIDDSKDAYPIAQQRQGTDHNFYLKDPIISDKGAVMMRFIEEIAGEEQLQTALQVFLKKYYYSVASWNDFITILNDKVPNSGMNQFGDTWVRQKGLPTIHTTYQDGQLLFTQKNPNGGSGFLPQKFEVRLIYDFDRSRTVSVNMLQPIVSIKLNKQPNTIIPNYDGRGYGHFTMDESYMRSLPLRIIVTRDDLNRYALINTVFDNYLSGHVPPSYFGELYRDMTKEKNPLIMRTAIDHMMKIAMDRSVQSERYTLEQCIMDLLPENKRTDCRQAIIRKMATCASAPEVLSQLYNIWQSQSDPSFDEHDYMELAYRLAITHPMECKDILNRQRQLLKDDLAREEFDFVSRACNPDIQARKALTASLKKVQDNKQKPWAAHALRLIETR